MVKEVKGDLEKSLRAYARPQGASEHERRQEMLEWIGEEFDPEEFAIVLANRGLKRIK